MQAKKILHEYFGYKEFKPGQEEVILNILNSKDVMVIMPTGGGKSLCFQIPALIFPGLSIVVSPLISLMKDQVDKVLDKNYPAALLNSTISYSEVLNTIGKTKEGKIKLLYVAPERFNSPFFKNFIKEIKVSFLAIDEAHCISEWGHDFRPSYLRLKQAGELMGNPVVAAFTATATPIVKKDIIKQLGLRNPHIVVKGFDRPNIKYLTIRLKESHKQRELLRILKNIKGSSVIYCSTKKNTDRIARFLRENDIKCGVYHAGLDSRTRHRNQDQFINGFIPVIAATNAFGMGIDKPDIRLIVHYNSPGSIEAFYQESGRAGRDGKISYSVVFGNSHDIAIQKYLIDMSFPTKTIVKKFLNFLNRYSGPVILKTYKELVQNFPEKISEVMVGNIIKILETHGLLKRLKDKDHPASITFKVSYDRIGQRNSTYPVRKKIIAYFQKEFSSMPINESFSFSIEKLLYQTGLTRERFVRHIKNIMCTNDIEFSFPFSGKGIQKLVETGDLKELSLNMDNVEEAKSRQLSKLHLVSEYVFMQGCKRKYLLEYFGEKYEEGNCKGCDYCLNWPKINYYEKEQNPKPEISRGIKQKKTLKKIEQDSLITDIARNVIYCGLLKYNNKIGIGSFVKLLKGSKDKTLIRKKLNSCQFYGKLENLNKQTIEEFLNKEKKLGYIKRSKSRLYPKILITDKGKEKIRETLAS